MKEETMTTITKEQLGSAFVAIANIAYIAQAHHHGVLTDEETAMKVKTSLQSILAGFQTAELEQIKAKVEKMHILADAPIEDIEENSCETRPEVIAGRRKQSIYKMIINNDLSLETKDKINQLLATVLVEV